MSKKKLLLFVVLPVSAVASLGAGVLAAYFMAPDPVAEPNQTTVQAAARQAPDLGLGGPPVESPQVEKQRLATQNQLAQEVEELMTDMKAKRLEYQNKLTDLKVEEARIAEVQRIAKEDLKRLNDMHLSIALALSDLKVQQQTLEENKIRVKKDENKNLKVMADVMGNMKPDNAADILINMVARPKGLEPNERLGVEEAALYIFFMNAKQQPKVFDAMIKDNNQDTAATLMATVKLIELEQ